MDTTDEVLGDVHDIVKRTVEAVLPHNVIKRSVSLSPSGDTLVVCGRPYNLNRYPKVVLVGGGKASLTCALSLAEVLGPTRISAGVINVPRGSLCSFNARNCGSAEGSHNSCLCPGLSRVKLVESDHPHPTEDGETGARAMCDLLRGLSDDTLVIGLISGGGSAMMAVPADPRITLRDYRETNAVLLRAPIPISKINAVRKHIDLLKGGRMRIAASGCGAFVTLAISDVLGDDPSVIASGPTVCDGTTFADAKAVLLEYGVWESVPNSVREYIDENVGRTDHETLRVCSPLLSPEKSQYVLLSNNDTAVSAAALRAEELGYKVQINSTKMHAEANVEVDRIVKAVSLVADSSQGDRVTLAFFSTDGVDGHSHLAGAIADSLTTPALSAAKGADPQHYAARFDSASFFQLVGGSTLALETGPTGTNVADLALALITTTTHSSSTAKKSAIVFGGEATVSITLPPSTPPGQGGRNTHMAILALSKLAASFPTAQAQNARLPDIE